MTMTVLVNAGPWLSVPPPGYGGIENVLAALVPELRRRGVRVVLATVGSSTLPVDDQVAVFPDGRFADLQRPYNRVMGVAAAHLHRVVRELRRRDDVVLVHDHQEAFGLTVLAALGRSCPPVLHTLHWDLRKHPELYGNVDGGGSLWVNGVSFAQLTTAPPALRALSVGHVHLSTPLAVDADRRPAVRKGEHLVVMGRVTRYKGQAVAARLAHRTGAELVLAGPGGAAPPPGGSHRAGTWTRTTRTSGTGARRSSRWSTGGGCAGWARWRARSATSWSPRRAPRSSRSTGRSRAGRRSSSRSRWARRWSGSGAGACPSWWSTAAPGCWSTRATRTRWPPRSAEATRLNPDDCRREAARRFTPARMADRYLRLYDKVLQRSGRPRMRDSLRKGVGGA